MHVQFIAEGAHDAPLVLIYGSDADTIRVLHQAVLDLARGVQVRVGVNKLTGFSATDECQLEFALGQARGIEKAKAANRFVCTLDKLSWEQVAGLIEPFVSEFHEKGVRFQYLDSTSPIALIISTDESW